MGPIVWRACHRKWSCWQLGHELDGLGHALNGEVIVAVALLLVLPHLGNQLEIMHHTLQQSPVSRLSFVLVELLFLLIDAEQVGDMYSFFMVLMTLHMHML